MTVDVDDATAIEARTEISDRRRPGRRPVSPELVALLRAPTKTESSGIALAVALSIPIWALIGSIIYVLL